MTVNQSLGAILPEALSRWGIETASFGTMVSRKRG
jgi:hypothetical protein